MSRTRADALALVNWRGVFYERYLLDRHVTALEGTNGAGKTTVMIAAYVALLPDMTRLRFTNLGETGASGGDKGIWGRLGDPGRPSYAVLDFILAGAQRLLAGVHLERKGEPSVEPTPFIVWGLDPTVRLQDLLLVAQGGVESVPELQELRENAARLGGRLQSYPSAREYFAALFDQGVMPLRLANDEERSKFNDMLRTSMTGGISRVLTSELRLFLLREQSGLADTLQRMRSNLDACRRTRVEVQESRHLEQEIGNILEAGQAMFTAALLATRERAAELARRVAEAQSARDQAHQAQEGARAALDETLAELDALDARRDELEHATESARDWHTRLENALAAQHELQRCTGLLAQIDREAQLADKRRDEAQLARTRHREALKHAQDGYRRAAEGLADLQQGIEELHRRAAAHRQATRYLEDAQKQLGITALAPAQFIEQLATARHALERVDQARRKARTRLSDAKEHRVRHAQLMATVCRLAHREVDASTAHDVATGVLRRHRSLGALAEQLADIEEKLAEAQRLKVRQAQMREAARELGVKSDGRPAAEAINAHLNDAAEKRGEHELAQRQANEALARLEHQREALLLQQQQLLEREPQWQRLVQCAARIRKALDAPLTDRASLDAARARLSTACAHALQTEEAVRQAQEQLLRDARELRSAGGPFSPALLQLKDSLDAELLASSYEEVPIKEAAVLEARLGPLAQALVVDDPAAAARSALDRPAELAHVLFVARDADLHHLADEAFSAHPAHAGDLLVHEGVALRVSRIPAKPRLGRLARERRAAELQAQAEEKTLELQQARAQRRTVEQRQEDGDALLAGLETWLAGDPTPALAKVRQDIASNDEAIARERDAAKHHAACAQALQARTGKLHRLLPDAALLDPPDQSAQVQALSDKASQAAEARRWVAANQDDVLRLEGALGDLSEPALSDADMAALTRHAEALGEQRQRLDAGIEALEYLSEHAQALAWHQAPGRLEASQGLIPALKAQLDEAESLQAGAEQKAAQAETQYDQDTEHFQEVSGRLQIARREHAAAAARLAEIGIPTPTKEALADAAKVLAQHEETQQALVKRRDELNQGVGTQKEALRMTNERLSAADEKLTGEQREAEPAARRWNELHERARHHGLIGNLLEAGPDGLGNVRGHVNLVQIATSRRERLLERLHNAQGGDALIAEFELLRSPSTDAAFADPIFNLWLAVHDWLRHRLPAQLAELADPRDALVRLRDQLSDLEERLARQESDLRGASEDVARGIEVQIRKARGQVNRLTKNLEEVSFGSIQGIRVRMQLIERMEQILRALREGAAQELLFQTDMPIEEALDEIFRRYGGGRSAGQRLLDYREYVHLQVEIRRKSEPKWEVANPTRLSTGEAIGVGAALMMVILTEWERDATLLRGKRAQGSLRFLFLDEANRLSPDNLGVLFDLCQTLELQLMIAAPEVARATGNTTYRLSRGVTPEGHEEVLVFGRRTRGIP